MRYKYLLPVHILIFACRIRAEVDPSKSNPVRYLESSLVGLEKMKADKLSRELGGSENPLSDIYDEILAMGSDGMLNH